MVRYLSLKVSWGCLVEIIDFAGQQAIVGEVGREARSVSFQVTILKVLAGSPGGMLSLAELRRDVAILISSGRDWTDRTKRMAARAPDFDIFRQALVLREPSGWQITAAGRKFLAAIEKAAPALAPAMMLLDDPPVAAPPMPLIGINTRRSRRRRSGRKKPRSVAA
jgi:hypothetical protein